MNDAVFVLEKKSSNPDSVCMCTSEGVILKKQVISLFQETHKQPQNTTKKKLQRAKKKSEHSRWHENKAKKPNHNLSQGMFIRELKPLHYKCGVCVCVLLFHIFFRWCCLLSETSKAFVIAASKSVSYVVLKI